MTDDPLDMIPPAAWGDWIGPPQVSTSRNDAIVVSCTLVDTIEIVMTIEAIQHELP